MHKSVQKKVLRGDNFESNKRAVVRHLIIGAVLTSLGIWGLHTWWANFGLVMRALVPFALLVSGLIALFSSYYRMTESDDDEASEDAPESAAEASVEAGT